MRLLVDISALVYRAAYKLAGLSYRGLKTGAIFGTLRSLETLAEMHEAEEMVVAWDGGHTRRSELYPDYKVNRKRDPEFVRDLERQKGILRRILGCLPVVHVALPGVEADDCIAAVASFCTPEKVGIVTGDQDLYPLAAPPLHVIISPKGGRAKLEMEPHHYLVYKVLVGDTSDNIKGVAGVGDKRARHLIAEHSIATTAEGTLRRILAEMGQTGECAGVRMDPAQHKVAVAVVNRNMKLMQVGHLLSADERTQILDQYRYGRRHLGIDESGLRKALMECGFSSLVNRLSGFLAPFRAMERQKHNAKAKAETNQGSHPAGDRPTSAHRQEGQARWVRIIRVVDGSGGQDRARDEGALRCRGREEEGAGEPARRTFDSSRAAEVASRLRKAQALGVASSGPRRRSEGAVRSAHAAKLSRASRAGTPLAPVLRDAAVLRQGRARRRDAVSLLHSLQGDEGWTWLKTRPTALLKAVKSIIDHIDHAENYRLTMKEVELLERLHSEYMNEPPEWM